MQLTEHVAYELRDRVAHVTLTRPEARNALSDAIAAGLVQAVEEIERDTKVRAVILSGEGPIFCAGGDLKACSGGGLPDPEAVEDHPVHAAFVEGAAAGG